MAKVIRNNGCFQKIYTYIYHADSIEIVNIIEETECPELSNRKVNQETIISKSSLHRILQDKQFYPYKPIIVQKLDKNVQPKDVILPLVSLKIST